MSLLRGPHRMPESLNEPHKGVSEELSLREMRQGLRGELPGLAQADALERLAASSYPNKHRDLEAVLEDETAPTRLRYLAALALARAEPRAAHQILITATRIEEPRILAGVMRALGQIGGREALDAIRRVLPNVDGIAHAQAQFASTLIAHRIGLAGFAPPMPTRDDRLELPPEVGERLLIRRALSSEVERSLVSLGSRPYGIELAEHPMYEFHCARCSGVIMLNRDYTQPDALETLARRPAIFAIGALRNNALGTYSAAAIFLTTPSIADVAISVHLTNGDQIFAGEGTVRGADASWTLYAVRRLGAFPIRAAGEFREGKLTIADAWSGTRVIQKARPRQLDSAALANVRQFKQRS